MTLRIIAGEHGGAHLVAPQGSDTRPTLGRVRESLFMILMPWMGEARVLDAFAGSGALALEALSRGAAHATLVEQARPALDAIAINLNKLRFQERARVVARDVMAFLEAAAPPGGQPFDIILLDPPYGQNRCHQAMERLGRHAEAWLDPEGIIAAQHGKKDVMAESYGPLRRTRQQDYGETKITFYKLQPDLNHEKPETNA